MKKILLSILAIAATSAIASTNVNLQKSPYSCNNVNINATTTESDITTNCKKVKVYEDKVVTSNGRNVSDERGGGADMIQTDNNPQKDAIITHDIRFTTDNGSQMKCIFKNGKLMKCKAYNKPTSKTATANS